MPTKSIFRQPGVKNFQLVHRSQRDPLIHDPEASEHVLKEFERKNVKNKRLPKDHEEEEEEEEDTRIPGEAALYGIYFDDRDYDYTQHLRTVGVEEKGVESILIEAPSRKPAKANKNKPLELIPKEALPSQHEIPQTYELQEAIPSSISGFQPDMDPHLRQTLEALDDEAFVDEAADDDFFGELLAEGMRDEDEDVDFEFHEDGLPSTDKQEVDGDEDDWQTRFAKFKLQQKSRIVDGSLIDGQSEGGDTLGRLPSLSVAGAKKRRRKGNSDASGYSMSSSSMFRNEGLTRLDEQFERFEKEYASDEGDVQMDNDSDTGSGGSAPPLITTREDFEAVLDDFLAQEQLGNKLHTKLEGKTPKEKLDTVRRALKEGDEDEQRRRKEALLNRVYKDDAPMLMPVDIDEKKERWDCETILSTYSNLENHPKLLRLTKPRDGVKKIRLDSKTGLPSVAEDETHKESVDTEGNDDSEEDTKPVKVTIARPKNETAEEKKARKQGVKQERQERRKEKKGTKQMFSSERKQQNRAQSTQEKSGIRKL
ncbi:Low temperature viability protein [Serendipita vermifera]|nr:Low temperature viability protein [Serendipita vermifera]